jgi:hypothetical protein
MALNPLVPLHRILQMLSSVRAVVPQRSTLLPGVVGALIVAIALGFELKKRFFPLEIDDPYRVRIQQFDCSSLEPVQPSVQGSGRR